MSKERPPRWEWKVAAPAQGTGPRLLYEPGNWGDILKGEWAAILTSHGTRPGQPFRYLDPFAGAPDYPLVAAARARLEGAPAPRFAELQATAMAAGRLASTASVVLEAARRARAAPRLLVFDADPERLSSWSRVPEAEALAAADGPEALLAAVRGTPPDLIVIDPYDLVDSWGALLGPAMRAARETQVLLYAYNKSPRSGGHARSYQSFRKALCAQRLDGTSALLGRVASDALLPRAWHEVIVIGPTALLDPLLAELRAAATRLATHLAQAGAVEDV